MPQNNNILARIQQLESMGLVDGQLAMCYSTLQPDNGDLSFAELVGMFYRRTITHLEMMENLLNDDIVVDFQVLYDICIDLKGSALSIGAVRVAEACSDLCEASRYRSADWCFAALNEIESEYLDLRAHIDEILQLL